MAVRVKICGITNREDAEAAVAAGADALGFILYEKSKRFISIEEAIRIVEVLPPFVQTVAVTVNAVKEFTNLGWRKQLKNFGVAQLHGEESPQHVKAVSKYLPVIKVLPATPDFAGEASAALSPSMGEALQKIDFVRAQLEEDLGRAATQDELGEELGLSSEEMHAIVRLEGQPEVSVQQRINAYDSMVSAFMLDTPSAEHGGTGRVFDWSLAAEFKKRITRPLIIAGGLNPENVAKAIQTVQPYAVDVVSGVEASPGRKDHAKLRDFIRICKSL